MLKIATATSHHYRLTIAYDGTDFFGWQIQPERISIQQTMQDAFYAVFKNHIWMLGASRTDAGVHAHGQVVLCKSSIKYESEKLRAIWNKALPPSICIQTCIEADKTFHPHVRVKTKTYWYQFFTERPSPCLARYGWYCARPLDTSAINEALRLFKGTHDFRAFCKREDAGENTIRTIDNIFLEQCDADRYRIVVQGASFMHHMIRRLVGAAFQVGFGARSLEELLQVLQKKNPNHTFAKAPAHGLILHAILYEEEEQS